jgi:putative peptide modification system cyclase
MNAMQNEPTEIDPASELTPSPPLLRTLVACDLVESTALTEQLGDRSIADFMHHLDRQARDLLERHGGIEIDKTDGFLLMFDRPIPAIAFALDYQRLLHDLGLAEFLPLKARIGIHVGDVVLWRNAANDVARGAKPVEVEGLVKPVAARLMGLALPGQILMSGVARALALRAQDELQIEFPPEWRMHGRYVFKGVAEPVPVFEIGEAGIAPLRSPAYSSKAFREVPWWRRPALLAIEVLVLLAAILVPAWISLRSPPVIAFAERDWVVVGNLKNLTEEHRFDDALDTAFRIGLEESRFVNVLSDLKVRDTITLMQRDPDKTSIDRSVGSEVALRDGARALILPTVAEVGRNVRVTAEVIDPQSQTTVYTESADGVGVDSVLASVDQISQRLREHLGEALASVSKDSQPLDKVVTKSIDALRAFGLGRAAYSDGKYAESITLFRQAVAIDPGFAMARAFLARSLLVIDRREEALNELDLAAKEQGRLSPRDSLYVEAWRLTLGGPPREAIEKLELLAKLYPDFFTGQSLFAYFSFELANRFGPEIVTAAERANSSQNPRPIPNRLLLGLLYLSNEQLDRSIEQFVQLEKEASLKHFISALPYAAKEQFDVAEATLAKNIPSDSPAANIIRFIPQAAIAWDRGHHDLALRFIEEGRHAASKENAHFVVKFQGIDLAMRTLSSSAQVPATMFEDYAKTTRDGLKGAERSYRYEAQFQVLLAAYLAAQGKQPDLANALLREVGPEPASGDYPVLAKMLAIVRAQLMIDAGNPDQAIKLLTESTDGSELFLTHAVLMQARLNAGDESAASQENRWLASHRGRAYGENLMQGMMMPINVALSDLARDKLRRTESATAVN